MAQIKPIEFPILGTATKLDVTINTFNVESTTCTTYNRLLNDDNFELLNWTYSLTEEEFSNWTTDTSYVVKCVAENKGIELL